MNAMPADLLMKENKMEIPENFKLVPEKETHQMREAFREAEKAALLSGHDHIEAFFCGYRAMLAAAPTPPAQDEPVAWHFVFNNGVETFTRDKKRAEEIRRYLGPDEGEQELYARPQSTDQRFTQEDEPVAMVDPCEISGIRWFKEVEDWTRLYTRPQSDKLRKAAEEFISYFDKGGSLTLSADEIKDPFEVVNQHLQNLRAVLEEK
jgi:hypothetical protein